MHSEYQARINKVIAYIDANLSGDLSLAQLDVALNAGYDNPTSFFRAFRQYFRSSPSAWRKKAAKEWAESQLSRKNTLRAQNSKIGNVLDPATWQILQGTDMTLA